jgi:hypothetical protein
MRLAIGGLGKFDDRLALALCYRQCSPYGAPARRLIAA